MKMPVRRFWLMNRNINRIQAENDVRMVTVMNAAQSQEGAKEYRESLIEEMGDVARAEAVRDEAGVDRLKNMCS